MKESGRNWQNKSNPNSVKVMVAFIPSLKGSTLLVNLLYQIVVTPYNTKLMFEILKGDYKMSKAEEIFKGCSTRENIERALKSFDCVYEIIGDEDDDNKIDSIALQCVSGRDSVKLALNQIEELSDISMKLSAIATCLYDVWDSLADPIENITNEKKNEAEISLYGAYLLLRDCADDLKRR